MPKGIGTSTLTRRMPRKRMAPVLKNPPSRRLGWEPSDSARTLRQAKIVAKSFPPSEFDVAIVKTGKRADAFPYTIYARDLVVQARRFARR